MHFLVLSAGELPHVNKILPFRKGEGWFFLEGGGGWAWGFFRRMQPSFLEKDMLVSIESSRLFSLRKWSSHTICKSKQIS